MPALTLSLAEQAIVKHGDPAADGFDLDGIASALEDIAAYAGLTVSQLHPDDVEQIANTFARWRR